MAAKKKKAAPKTKPKLTDKIAKELVKKAKNDGIVLTNKTGKGFKTKREAAIAWLKKQPSKRPSDKGKLGVYWSVDNLKRLEKAYGESLAKVSLSPTEVKTAVNKALKEGTVLTSRTVQGFKTHRAKSISFLKSLSLDGFVGVFYSMANLKKLADAYAKTAKGKKKIAAIEAKLPKPPYSAGRKRAQKSSKKSATGAVMGHKTKIFIVLKKVGDKPETVMGAYPSRTAAKIAGRNLLASIARAYNPFIPSSIGAMKTTPERGKHYAVGRLKVNKWVGDTLKMSNQGSSGAALKYLMDTGVLEKSKKKSIEVKIVTVNLNGNSEKDKKYRAYFELYNSPVYGNLRWNPKKRRR